MQLETLKVYCDVISHHSFSQAAEVNHITQSTASQSVHRLEEHFGSELIDRSVRPWRITDAGRRCYEYSRNVLEAYSTLEREMRIGAESIIPEIRVGTIYSVGFCYMQQYVAHFNAIHPDDSLHIEYLNPNVIVERILDEQLDIGIISYPSTARGLTVQPWHEEEMVLATPPTHPLAACALVQLKQLDGQTFACFDQDLQVAQKIDQFMRQHGVHRKVVLRFDNIEAIKRAVQNSNLIAVLPRPTLESELGSGALRAIPFADGQLTRPLGIVTRKGRCMTPSMQRFMNTLGQSAVIAA
jgi:DNA-binding transcriptional LysR family regulator